MMLFLLFSRSYVRWALFAAFSLALLAADFNSTCAITCTGTKVDGGNLAPPYSGARFSTSSARAVVVPQYLPFCGASGSLRKL